MSINPGVDTQTTSVVPLTSEYPLVRVDLMPPEVLADRKFRKARGGMVLAVVGTLALTGGVFWLAASDADRAAEELAVEQARTTELNAEAAQYAAVPAILAQVDRAETALDTAMATDIEWYRYLSQMSSVTPEGVWFTNITMTAAAPTAPTTGGDPLAPVDSVADVLTTGKAITYEDVATWMDSVESISGYDHVLFSNAALKTDAAEADVEPYVDFLVSVEVLPDAYSDRYVPEAE
jgi:Tfp pilus assembly protein PilN